MNQPPSTLVPDVRTHADGAATVSSQIAQGNQDPVVPHRKPGQRAGRDGRLDGGAQLHRTAERRQRPPGQPARRRCIQWLRRGGDAAVAEVVETMKGINDSSHRINDIISVIDGIAFQTNIPALNGGRGGRAGE